MLKSSAADYLKEKSPVESLRKLRDTKDAKGYDVAVWKEMVDMGWTGLAIDEAYGGLGFGYVGLGQVLEETGRTLTASPLIANVAFGASVINYAGTTAQKEILLSEISMGNLITTVACEESTNHKPLKVATTATVDGDNYVINGSKKFVLDGHVADQLIVSAKSDKGIQLFMVPADSDGVEIDRRIMMDSRNASNINFNNVKVPTSARLGDDKDATMALVMGLDIARICLSAEMLGSMQEAFERTVAYLKERQQFGIPIGRFQGLQHRAAHMFSEIEICKGIVLASLQAIDKGDFRLPGFASACKAKCGEVFQLVTNEAIQMYGGIGMTDDEEIGFYMKRARVAQQTFGDYNYHYDRYATLNGF